MHPVLLVLIFIVSALVGYKLISNVPSLLHTPLMSGMNARCRATILGAGRHRRGGCHRKPRLGFVAIVLAMLNVAGGFGVTGIMLAMFKHKEGKK